MKLLNDFFHDGDIEHIPEEAVHLNHVFQGKPEEGKTAFHLVEGAVDLFLKGAADIADAVAQKAVIPGFDDPGVRPIFADILPNDLTHFLSSFPRCQTL